MGRAHYDKKLKGLASHRPLQGPRLGADENPSEQQQVTLDFTGELIEAFVVGFLLAKYDNPAPIPNFHREIWGACASASSKVLVLAPRGHAKSTSITEAYGLAAMLFRQRDFALVVSNTWAQSVEFLRDIKDELLHNDYLRSKFEVEKLLKDAEDDIIVKMADGHVWRMVARGAEQKVRGVKWNKKRPNLVLFDDLEDDEQVNSQERRLKFSKWFMNALLQVGNNETLFRGAATILHFDSLAENLSKDSTWLTLRFRAHRGFDDFSDILWPEKYNEAQLREIRQGFINQGNSDGYSQEYLNYPIAEGESFFRGEDLLPIEPERHSFPKRFYTAWDFAISKSSKADYTVGITFGVDTEGITSVLDVRRGRWDGKEIIDEMFSVQKAFGPTIHFVEKGALEKALGSFIYDEMRRRSTYFNIQAIAPTGDKVARAAGWRAKTRAHAVRYDHKASWWPALREEMIRFPKGEHDDQVDPQSIIGLQLEYLVPSDTEDEIAEEAYQIEFGVREVGRSATTGY
jgi:predicted phage terminase large subunit-like protein